MTVPSMSPLAIRPPLDARAAAQTSSWRWPRRDITRDNDRVSYTCTVPFCKRVEE
jgi:hypothetical protein